ncbi:sulfate/thiosulfate import ATP-binding protein CysA [Clostridium homopropionicum DSM 5847]|uniref:Sulfate/thiosulfate import ATP-binding protein CysA n=1 Tax=Clostridium homopropionicum DSM 5847 TaxID=1121318 RepID=A0A0L6Z6N2_9CLOT|nr:sulfate/molybdate ABC transporter ATP-binding protein [Clostridium homopropionicum]KOA18624.1 sulfate/thiosulfate import ATP-binding protein CysA [Clostridium homopropionicum DSM 5847]SFG50466.1 molybdate transport system ATP-binding protein [Clostridium homopropionicum]
MNLLVDIEKKFLGFNYKVAFTADENTLGLLGSSGSGKSMTLRCIAGLEKPDRGRIVLNGRVLFDSEKRINLTCQKRKVGFLFQNYALFPNMTVAENIGFALNNISKDRLREKVAEKISMIQLEGLENRYPYQLSGGQQQRVALARALAIEPEVLLLDEPFSALDNHLRNHLEKQLIKTLSDYNGISIFVSHNMEEVYRVCKRLVILSEGKVEAEGEKEEIFNNPHTRTAARLTGCKNISLLKIVDDYEIEAIEWGCRLNMSTKCNKELKYVGIREDHIDCAESFYEENVFRGWVVDTLISPQKITLYISFKEPLINSISYDIQLEMRKEKWDKIKDNYAYKNGYFMLPVKLNKERLILMEK